MRILLFALAALALPACSMPMAEPPANTANATIIDEQAALSVELAYQAAATAVLTAERAGVIPAAARPRVAAADRRAYAAVRAARAAYDTGNADSYAAALPRARAAVADFLSSIGG